MSIVTRTPAVAALQAMRTHVSRCLNVRYTTAAEKPFNPRSWYQWLSYLPIATGWPLATTVAAGITGSVSRQ